MKQEEDDHVKIEANTEVTPQTKEYLGSPETGEGKKGPSPRGFGGSRALPATSPAFSCRRGLRALCVPWNTDHLPSHMELVVETLLRPWIRKIPGGGRGNRLQYSCLENPMDRGA